MNPQYVTVDENGNVIFYSNQTRYITVDEDGNVFCRFGSKFVDEYD
jgi:hypothetical protein